MLRSAHRLALAALVVLALAACGSSGGKGASGTTTTTKATGASSSTSSTTPTTLDAVFETVAKLSLVNAPDGFKLQEDSVAHTGPSDLDKAASDDGSSDARDVLTKDGFVAGYQRLWLDPNKDQVVVVVYQFDSADGAKNYASKGLQDVPEGVTAFPVPDIPSGHGLSGETSGSDGALISFSQGPFAAQVVVVSSTGTPVEALQARVTTLANELYQAAGNAG